jgi:F-type H+-transporting ATPase subunit gamma
MALKQIKNKIRAAQRTSKVTKAMEAVSAVKMRKSQERAIDGRTYAEAALRILERVSHVRDAKAHPLFAPHEKGKHCAIVVTSDKGLAGSLNSAVLKEADALVKKYPKETVDVICFGKKSYEFFIRRGYRVPFHYLNVKDDVDIDDLENLVTHVTEEFIAQKYQNVHAIYQTFISTFEQKPVIRHILPLKTSSLQEIVQGIVPRKGKYSDIHMETKSVAYAVEPNQEQVYKAIFPMLIKIMLYHSLLESKASEHSARMVAMKNATDKADDVSKILTLKYNKERQSVITAEISEITGGIEALKV